MTKINWKRKSYCYGLSGLILVMLPFLIPDLYLLHIINMILISSIVVLGMNIVMGYAGQFMLAQAAFYGVGAYTSAILATTLGLPFWICLPCAVVFTGLAGLLTSLPCLRVKGHYLAIVSLGVAVIIHEAIINMTNVTKGPSGIIDIPSPSIFGIEINTSIRYYYMLIILVCLSVLFISIIMKSRVGRAFIAIRESVTAAEAMGINYRTYTVLAFVLSASFAGLGGSLYAHLVNYVSPDSFGISEVLSLLAMLVVGGIGTISGPIIGSVILGIGYEYLRSMQNLQMVIYGLIILIFVLFMPRGLVTFFKVFNYKKFQKIVKEKF